MDRFNTLHYDHISKFVYSRPQVPVDDVTGLKEYVKDVLHLTNKNYVEDIIDLQTQVTANDGDITTLQNKTSILNTSAQLINSLIPSANNVYSLGDTVNRFQDLYCANQVYSTLFKGVALRNPASNLGLQISNIGDISFDASQYLGTADSVCSFTTNGVIQKSSLTTTDIHYYIK